MKELTKIIVLQQKGHNEDPIFMVGEQLKEMAQRDPSCIEILKHDLQIEKMGLEGAAGALQAYSDKNHGNAKCFVISPARAEVILREFYGLPESKKNSQVYSSISSSLIDLESFM